MSPIAGAIDWSALEQRRAALFGPGCDPYRASAAALFAKLRTAILQYARDAAKRVFKRVEREHALRAAADRFHEVGSAFAAEAMGPDSRNWKIADKLRAVHARPRRHGRCRRNDPRVWLPGAGRDAREQC